MKKRMSLPWAAVACAGWLSACGGGDDAAPAPPAPPPTPAVTDAVPDSASQSAAGLVSYLTALAAADAEAKEPVDVSHFTPVQPEDSEPEAV